MAVDEVKVKVKVKGLWQSYQGRNFFSWRKKSTSSKKMLAGGWGHNASLKQRTSGIFTFPFSLFPFPTAGLFRYVPWVGPRYLSSTD